MRNSKNLNSWMSPRSAKTNDSLKKVTNDIKIIMGGDEEQKMTELTLEHARKLENSSNNQTLNRNKVTYSKMESFGQVQ